MPYLTSRLLVNIAAVDDLLRVSMGRSIGWFDTVILLELISIHGGCKISIRWISCGF